VDKLTLAALEATLALYRDPQRALREIPVLAMLGTPVDALRERARRLRDALGALASHTEIVESTASVGGGAFPTARIPSIALAFDGDAGTLERRLRLGEPAVIGRVADERLLIDLRAVATGEDAALAEAIGAALHGAS
jgi:L-seryl-tRNA(Ser) seleniumtransferase